MLGKLLESTLTMSLERFGSNCRWHGREVGAIMLAHNLIWQLMHEAGEAEDVPVERIGFKGTIQTVLAHGYRFKTAAPPSSDLTSTASCCNGS